MTSSEPIKELFVWVWLPGAVEPVPAGRIYRAQNSFHFNYGNRYVERDDAISLNPDELPLRKGAHQPIGGMVMPNCLRDGSPDAWGRRVIIHRMMGASTSADTQMDELTYLIESGSDRIGALDFQRSAREYVPRETDNASLEELLEASSRVEKGLPLTPELDRVLNHGTSIGGARPKALLQDGDTKYVAKFSSSTDSHNVVKGEFVAMRLAEMAGLDVAPVRMEAASGRDVLLVERFDRSATKHGFTRKLMLSALTLFQLDEMMARYAGYDLLADLIRQKFHNPTQTLRELYRRMVFNVLCGNTDDHARNHAAFYDGEALALTPAYDICPQNRSTGIASQAMALLDGRNQSTLALCREAAQKFSLSPDQAEADIQSLRDAIEKNWNEACDQARMTETEKRFFWGRQFLNPSVFEG